MCSANAGWSVGLRKNICHVLFYFHTRKEYRVIFKHLILWFSLEGSWGVEGGNGYSREQSGTDCDFTKKRSGSANVLHISLKGSRDVEMCIMCPCNSRVSALETSSARAIKWKLLKARHQS